MVIVKTPRGSNPSGTCWERQKLFNVNPAPASNTTAKAICITTKISLARR